MLRKFMPKLSIALLLALIMIFGLFIGCAKTNNTSPTANSTGEDGQVYTDKDPKKNNDYHGSCSSAFRSKCFV